ncbi:MAG: hypothetical protein ACHQ7M_06830 [Chloroflexota bacterium]
MSTPLTEHLEHKSSTQAGTHDPDSHALALHLLGPASTLTGTCLAGVALLRIEERLGTAMLADNVLGMAALLFLASTTFGYLALRRRSVLWRIWTEITFAAAVTVLGLVLAALVYEGVLV